LFYKFNSLLVIYIPIFILTLWFSQVSVSFAVNSNNTVGLRGLKKAAENSLMFTEFYSLNYLRECAFVRKIIGIMMVMTIIMTMTQEQNFDI